MINVLFCGNDKVFDGMLTCILSILNRTSTKEPFRFFIFTMDVSHIKDAYVPIDDKYIEVLNKVIKEYNQDNVAIKIDVTLLYMKHFDKCPNEGAYCSPYTLIRLFANSLPEDIDKLLYLDADIMFNKDITLLYNIDIEGYEYAAARDHYGKYLLYYNYINAGVLLFNMKEARKTNLFIKAQDNIKKKKYLFADQTALVKATTKKKMLPQKFNDQKFLHKNRTVVRHFSKRLFYFPYPHTDNIKQWHIEKVHKVFKYHVFDDIYDKYLKIKEETKLWEE